MASKKKGIQNEPVVISVIEDLRRKGYNQSEIAEMYGVTRQAVSWHKIVYGGAMTTRQIVNKSWPWKTTNWHGKSKLFQRLRDHGEFMATGGKGMNADKRQRLRSFLNHLKDNNLVVEFDPEIPPEAGVSPHGGFALRPREESDGKLIIRVNEHTTLTKEGKLIWVFPPRDP